MANGNMRSQRFACRPKSVALAVMLTATQAASAGEPGDVKLDGFLRQEFSWNTADWKDTPNYNDRGKLSMARTTARTTASGGDVPSHTGAESPVRAFSRE